ncbi:aminoacyl-tRNA hydrolase [Sodalis-like secondary symbiont of Drepanosiphum platanoidis]|uniref:aminoacyl-tRNA hydrolase n=1 Tax=Sodalis-like secondary symbiont of Drepanosiphum platanoidis TaxID=2994493 RepID=UPI003463BF6D
MKKKNKFLGYLGLLNFKLNKIYLFIPNVFINLSGKSVLYITKFYNIKTEEILIIHDELNLSPGQIKFNIKKNYSTHNGLKNIVKELNNNSFNSLKIGIGHPGFKKNIIKFVLSSPTILEKKLIINSIKKSIKNINYIIKKNKK